MRREGIEPPVPEGHSFTASWTPSSALHVRGRFGPGRWRARPVLTSMDYSARRGVFGTVDMVCSPALLAMTDEVPRGEAPAQGIEPCRMVLETVPQPSGYRHVP